MDFQMREKLLVWMRRQLAAAREESLQFRVRHVRVDQRTEPLTEYDARERALEEISSDILEACANDAGALGGVQTYGVFAFKGEDQNRPWVGRYIVRIAGDSLHAGDDPAGTEPPTPAGLSAQQMRHNEILLKTNVSAIGGVVDHYQAILASQAARIRELEQGEREAKRLTEELMSQKHQRELEVTREQRIDKHLDGIADKVQLLLPTVVNRITGKTLLPESTSPEVEILRAVLNELTSEQLDKLRGILSPTQLVGLLELARHFAAQKEAAAAANANGAGTA